MTADVNGRLILIAASGLDWPVFVDGVRRGSLPALDRLRARGLAMPVRPSSPLSPLAAYADIATGVPGVPIVPPVGAVELALLVTCTV